METTNGSLSLSSLQNNVSYENESKKIISKDIVTENKDNDDQTGILCFLVVFRFYYTGLVAQDMPNLDNSVSKNDNTDQNDALIDIDSPSNSSSIHLIKVANNVIDESVKNALILEESNLEGVSLDSETQNIEESNDIENIPEEIPFLNIIPPLQVDETIRSFPYVSNSPARLLCLYQEILNRKMDQVIDQTKHKIIIDIFHDLLRSYGVQVEDKLTSLMKEENIISTPVKRVFSINKRNEMKKRKIELLKEMNKVVDTQLETFTSQNTILSVPITLPSPNLPYSETDQSSSILYTGRIQGINDENTLSTLFKEIANLEQVHILYADTKEQSRDMRIELTKKYKEHLLKSLDLKFDLDDILQSLM
ncbi:hypothetical protein WA158_000197 [Blastocystis sp. Blastoise]